MFFKYSFHILTTLINFETVIVDWIEAVIIILKSNFLLRARSIYIEDITFLDLPKHLEKQKFEYCYMSMFYTLHQRVLLRNFNHVFLK